jgi:hypothetical protein
MERLTMYISVRRGKGLPMNRLRASVLLLSVALAAAVAPVSADTNATSAVALTDGGANGWGKDYPLPDNLVSPAVTSE